jgi:hypothetical protein
MNGGTRKPPIDETFKLGAGTLRARNDVGGYFFCRYTRPDGKLQSVDALSALGAVAGAFARRQAWAMLKSGATPAERRSWVSAQGADGHTYWFGDALNYVVFEARGQVEPHLSLYSLVGPAAGVPDPEAVIDFAAIFANAAATVGGPRFAVPRETGLPTPNESFTSAVKAHVPVLKARLAALHVTDLELVTVFGTAAQGFVPIAAGERAGIPTAGSLSRLAAVQLFFEAAIPASKLDPSVTGV